jgi:hypothetical protein
MVGVPVPETWEEDDILLYQDTLFTGDFERYVKKALESGSFLHRGPIG